MRRLAGLAALIVLVAAGCGGDGAPSDDPGAFVTTLVRTLYRGDSAAAWEWLHPRHRAVVSKRRYAACEGEAPLEGEARRIAVVSVRDEPSLVPGEDEPVASKAVTFRVLLKLPGIPSPQPITHTAHVFAVDGEWTWVIGPDDYATYALGDCPGRA